MPRRLILPNNRRAKAANADLVARLAGELTTEREYGQPVIEEEELPGAGIRVVVIWDAWDRMTGGDRMDVIRGAYERTDPDRAKQLAMTNGLTVPEAHAAGWLPFQIIPALRATDPVTPEQCREAMITEGASVLMDSKRTQLRCATLEEAEAAVARLSARLPGSEPVWVINQELVDVTE